MSERIPGHDLAARAAGGELTADVAVVAAARLGAAVGRLHAHGLRNRDLKFENLVLHAATGDVVMVDLDGVGRKSPHDRRGQANDLARLLAAFRTAGAPGGNWSVRAFVRSYTRARQCQGLRSKITKAMRRRIAARASGLASRSRRTNTS
jgi:tRNA A-37 threonylcarbamoyl transferase component Bud32